jgi:hypothetical protein
MGNAEVDPCDKDLFRDYVKQWWFFEDSCGVEHGNVTFKYIEFSLVNL